jgi:hypothetical protein
VRTDGQSSRTLGAFVQMRLTGGDLDLQINGAGSFGGRVEVSGNSKIIGQAQDVSRCGTSGAVPAIEVSKDGSVVAKGGSDLIGGSQQTTETREQFQRRILNGYTPLELAQRANIKFGPLLTPSRVFPNNFKASATVPKDSVRNWGCNVDLVKGRLCQGAYADTAYFPVIGIDAQGGEVDLQGDYGQGILVVVNGKLRISGNFDFKGIIIVEGALDITGTVNVTGAVVGFNTITVGKDNTNDLSGTMNITYDPCVNERVQQEFNDANPQYSISRPVYGWFEVVK